jgi:hypothetical protein
MAQDDRDILEVLYEELDFIEKGGYGRSVRTPWQPTSVFQDSLSCLNYGYPYRAHPCSECRLIDFVPATDRANVVPCHHIPLDETGATIEALEEKDNQHALEETVKEWLRTRIKRIERERAEARQQAD